MIPTGRQKSKYIKNKLTLNNSSKKEVMIKIENTAIGLC